MKTWKYNVVITKVIDGDSFRIENFDLGMGVYLNKVTVRLLGANTWESRSKNLAEKSEGLKAKEIVKKLIESKEVELETFELDKYGRVLGKIKCVVGDLTEYLIKEKLAYPYFGETKKKFDL